MKNLYKYAFGIVVAIGIVASCTTYEYEEPNSTAGIARAVHSLDLGVSDDVTQARINDSVTFTDFSLESESRSWQLSGAKVDILGTSNDESSEERSFTAIFKATGEVTAVLRPVFENPVVDSISTFTFNFTVLPLIRADFSLDSPTVGGELVVEAGQDVTFTNLSSEQENAEWTFTNTTTGNVVSTSSEVETVVARFGSIGNYTATLRAFTNEPFSEDTKTITFRVIASSQPLTVEPTIGENEEGELIVSFSRDINPETIDELDSYMLTVDGESVNIVNAEIDPDNPANLLLTPFANIKNSQTASLSYTRVTLNSADAVAAPSFEDAPVVPFGVNLFAKGDFEGVTTDQYDVNNGFLGNNSGVITADLVDGVGDGGSRGLVFTGAANATSGSRRTLFGDKDSDDVQIITPLEGGKTYLVKARVKYSGTIPDQVRFSMVKLPFAFPTITNVELLGTLVEGEFVDVEGEFVAGGNLGPDAYALPNVTVGDGASETIIDNVRIFEKEE